MKEKTRQKRFFILTGLFMMLLAAGWGIKPHTVKAYVGTFNAAARLSIWKADSIRLCCIVKMETTIDCWQKQDRVF